MKGIIPGTLCSTKCGLDWIDYGTLCRSQSSGPGTLGLVVPPKDDICIISKSIPAPINEHLQILYDDNHKDRGKALADVDAPVLVIHGADDLQSESASRLYSDAFPNAEFVVIQKASHFSSEQQPEQFAQIVSEFLATTRP